MQACRSRTATARWALKLWINKSLNRSIGLASCRTKGENRELKTLKQMLHHWPLGNTTPDFLFLCKRAHLTWEPGLIGQGSVLLILQPKHLLTVTDTAPEPVASDAALKPPSTVYSV